MINNVRAFETHNYFFIWKIFLWNKINKNCKWSTLLCLLWKFHSVLFIQLAEILPKLIFCSTSLILVTSK
jgi:hypothetical protein